MSEIWSGGEKKEMLLEGGDGAYLEEGQCDSGIILSVPCLASLGKRSPGPWLLPEGSRWIKSWNSQSGKEEPADERLDSSYGSSSIVESLTGLQGEPNLEKEEEEERLRQQLLKTLDFLSEDGDMLLHLAIIRCVPSIVSFCIAQMPVEVLEFQHRKYKGRECIKDNKFPIRWEWTLVTALGSIKISFLI